MSGNPIAAQRRRTAGPRPVALIAVALWIVWGFGYETVWQRLALERDGTVIARREIPRSWASHGTATAYVVRGADGRDQVYVRGATDASLPGNIPVGGDIEKRKWERSYSLNGGRIDDFPTCFCSAWCGVALTCALWAVLQRVRRQDCRTRAIPVPNPRPAPVAASGRSCRPPLPPDPDLPRRGDPGADALTVAGRAAG